ncbi:MAG: hypothetical protein E6J41_02075 [Chloroflexi bacterium]|nr:MAG: hypothetical protein E6J41_02075 [Chloroflexota bacterium]
MLWKRLLLAMGAGALGLVPVISASGQVQDPAAFSRTATPIKHLVVIFQENVSFDHYFATYPFAANGTKGEPAFRAADGTPNVNGLNGPLLTNNPNLANPQRLSRDQALTCDQDHGYTDEQLAMDHGGMDMFVQKTGAGLTLAQCLAAVGNKAPAGGVSPNNAVMDYYDGNHQRRHVRRHLRGQRDDQCPRVPDRVLHGQLSGRGGAAGARDHLQR